MTCETLGKSAFKYISTDLSFDCTDEGYAMSLVAVYFWLRSCTKTTISNQLLILDKWESRFFFSLLFCNVIP